MSGRSLKVVGRTGPLAGQTALVTGASAGIGAAFAVGLAAAGADLVLVARRADRLASLAEQLREQHGTTVHEHPCDLVERGAVTRLAADLAASGTTVDVLVNNAGVGLPMGPLHEADPAALTAMLDLNVVALAQLTRAFLPAMIEAGSGSLLNVASLAAFQPTPQLAGYGATKAFVLSLTEAVWAETRGTGVRVLAVCPGITVTEFFDVAGPHPITGSVQTAEEVVAEALTALTSRGPRVVTGRRNRLLSAAAQVLPRSVTTRLSTIAACRSAVPDEARGLAGNRGGGDASGQHTDRHRQRAEHDDVEPLAAQRQGAGPLARQRGPGHSGSTAGQSDQRPPGAEAVPEHEQKGHAHPAETGEHREVADREPPGPRSRPQLDVETAHDGHDRPGGPPEDRSPKGRPTVPRQVSGRSAEHR